MHNIYTKAEKRLNMLKQLKLKLTRKTFEKIHFCFRKPISEYGDVILLGASQSDLCKLGNIAVATMTFVLG